MNKRFLPAIVCGLTVAAVGILLISEHRPPSGRPTSDKVTAPTTYYENFFLPTTPSMWYTVGETVNWNDIFTFCAEELTVQKTLPDGFQKEDFRFVNRVPKDDAELAAAPEWFEAKADDDFTLISDHLYVTLTLHITCTGAYPYEFFGLEDDTHNWISVGNCVIGEYDTQAQQIVREHRLACHHLPDPTFHVENGLFEMGIGDSTTVHIAYVVRESLWNSDRIAFLFTPMHAHYDAFTLDRLEFTLPQIWLNKEKHPV